ncbi:hypothetical protein ACWDKQ_28870, partial [Saccharopolyspora sp. NPDC000995]
DLPEAERRGRLGNLAGIAEVAELAGRMQRHLKAMPPGFDPDGQRASNVEAAKRMVRQGAWTAEDLQWVEDRLPGMRKVEKAWRGLARSSRRAAAQRELQVLSDQATAGLEELSGPARDSLLDAASEKLGAPLNGSSQAVSVMAYHMMRGDGDGEIAQVRGSLARIWEDLTAVSAGAGPEPGSDPGPGPNPGTPTGDADVADAADAAIDDAGRDEFDTFMKEEQPGLLKRLESLGEKEEPSGSSMHAPGSVVDSDAVYNSTDGGAWSTGDSSSPDSGGSRPVDRTKTNLTNPDEFSGGTDRIERPSDSSNDGKPPNRPADVQVRADGLGADLIPARGDSHRQDGAAVSPDSAMPSGQGAQTAPLVDRDAVAVLPVGLPVDTVRVAVSAKEVAGDGLAEFVRGRGGVADSTGPVVLVSPGDPDAGVVVMPGQGSALAQDLGRNVVAMTSGQAGQGPRFMVFAADGSRPKPLAGPGAGVLAGESAGGAGLAEASAAVPAASGGTTVARDETPPSGTGSAQARSVAGEVQPAATTPGAGAGTVRDTSEIPVGQWTQEELNHAIDQAKKLELSSGEKDAAGLIVQRTHDVAGLARADAVVPLEDVVALVAAKRRNRGDDEVVAFSRALADRLGTRRSEPIIQAGAGPSPLSDVEPVPVPFGELKPPVDGGPEPHGSEAEYARDRSRGSLPDVVNGRSVVLSEEELAGVSEQGRAALNAFAAATGVAARPRLADVDGHNVGAFIEMLHWWRGVGHAVVVKKRKTTWSVRSWEWGFEGLPDVVQEGTDVWYVMGEDEPGARPDSATRPKDLWGPLTERPPEQLWDVPADQDPDGDLLDTDGNLREEVVLEYSGESVEFFVHVVDPAGVRVEYGLADPWLWRRGREVEWEGLFAALEDAGPAALMDMVNPGVGWERYLAQGLGMGMFNPGLGRKRYLAQALGVDETTARVWRMRSHLPEWGVEALRRAFIGSVVSKYGGREAVQSLVETLLPDGPPYEQRLLRALGQFMMRRADPGRLPLGGRDTRIAADYRRELEEAVARPGGLDELARATDSRVQVRDLSGLRGRQPSPRELRVLQELERDLDGRELDYLTRFFGEDDYRVSDALGVSLRTVREWRRGRPDDRAMVRGIVFDTVVEAFGGPERAVALADRLRVLGGFWRVRMFSQGPPEWASAAAQRVFGLSTTQDWWDWTLGDLVKYVAEGAVPAGVPDGELVRYLGPTRAAAVTSVDQSTAQAWLDGSRQPDPTNLRLMREAARLPDSELVRYLGPGRALEVIHLIRIREREVWEVLTSSDGTSFNDLGIVLPQAVLGAIAGGVMQRPQPLRRVVWSESGIREAERRLAWADATKEDEFPSEASEQWKSEAWEQWKKVNAPVPSLRPESQKVIDGLGKSLKASVHYIVVQVFLGNKMAKDMVKGSGIVIPDPSRPGAITGLLEQIAHHIRTANGAGASGDGSLDVLASQTPDSAGERSPAGIPHGSGVFSDAALTETVTSGTGAVADSDGGAASLGPAATTRDGGAGTPDTGGRPVVDPDLIEPAPPLPVSPLPVSPLPVSGLPVSGLPPVPEGDLSLPAAQDSPASGWRSRWRRLRRWQRAFRKKPGN